MYVSFYYRQAAVLFNSGTLDGLQPNEGALLYSEQLKGLKILNSGNTQLWYIIELCSLRLSKAVGRNFKRSLS
jgi:hypothetical protein